MRTFELCLCTRFYDFALSSEVRLVLRKQCACFVHPNARVHKNGRLE